MHRFIKIRIVKDLDNLEERVRTLRQAWLGWHAAPSFRPAADLFQTAHGLVLRLEVAGVLPEEMSLELRGQELLIQGRRRLTPPDGATKVLQHEMATGVFERRFLLPVPIDHEGIQARYLHGILEVTLQYSTPRRIPVKSAAADPGSDNR